mmetsp:Transcript_43574/g.59514  ORF Transcript_43574/g.59514 Transcript_43574/m.59514 type:complete len:210 (+) Transcript_43574:598-1227(+)
MAWGGTGTSGKSISMKDDVDSFPSVLPPFNNGFSSMDLSAMDFSATGSEPQRVSDMLAPLGSSANTVAISLTECLRLEAAMSFLASHLDVVDALIGSSDGIVSACFPLSFHVPASSPTNDDGVFAIFARSSPNWSLAWATAILCCSASVTRSLCLCSSFFAVSRPACAMLRSCSSSITRSFALTRAAFSSRSRLRRVTSSASAALASIS